MVDKHKGMCPFCKEVVVPSVLEENTVRRDKCLCPSCQNVIYVCRAPGCDNFARGGDIYDDELCPECLKGASSTAGTIVTTVGLAVLTAIATAVVTKSDDS